jgi:hypothetical protein
MACAYCDSDITQAIGTAGCSLDHVLPHGGNHESNLLTVCKRCNDAKGGCLVESYCEPERLAKIRKQLLIPVDVDAGDAAWKRWKGGAGKEKLPPLPTLTMTQAAHLVGMTREDFSARVTAGTMPSNAGSFFIPDIVLAAIRYGSELGDGVISKSEADRQLVVKRCEQIDLEMEVTRKQRIPLDVLDSINETAFSNVVGMLKAHEGKMLTAAAIGDMLGELREIGARVKDAAK